MRTYVCRYRAITHPAMSYHSHGAQLIIINPVRGTKNCVRNRGSWMSCYCSSLSTLGLTNFSAPAAGESWGRWQAAAFWHSSCAGNTTRLPFVNQPESEGPVITYHRGLRTTSPLIVLKLVDVVMTCNSWPSRAAAMPPWYCQLRWPGCWIKSFPTK